MFGHAVRVYIVIFGLLRHRPRSRRSAADKLVIGGLRPKAQRMRRNRMIVATGSLFRGVIWTRGRPITSARTTSRCRWKTDLKLGRKVLRKPSSKAECRGDRTLGKVNKSCCGRGYSPSRLALRLYPPVDSREHIHGSAPSRNTGCEIRHVERAASSRSAFARNPLMWSAKLVPRACPASPVRSTSRGTSLSPRELSSMYECTLARHPFACIPCPRRAAARSISSDSATMVGSVNS